MRNSTLTGTQVRSAILQKQLLETFAPIALAMITEHPNLGGTDFATLGLAASIIMGPRSQLAQVCLLRLELKKELCANELIAIAQQLDRFCNYEHGPGCYGTPAEIEGVKWVIGDGDDSQAVVFHTNAFHIWVRTFAE